MVDNLAADTYTRDIDIDDNSVITNIWTDIED